MKFKNYQYPSTWTETQTASNDLVIQEATKRAKQNLEGTLSSILLSDNLVILTGLGTSLCLKDAANNHIAPTMADLWNLVSKATTGFDAMLTKVRQPKVPTGGWLEDIETLLSRCQMSVGLEEDATIRDFINKAEELIVKGCSFLNLLPVGAGLPIHEAFLRKIARRPTRLQRTKLFATNYDLCFEAAAGASGFVLIDGFSHSSPQEFDGTNFSYDIVRREPESDIPAYISNVVQLLKLHGSVDWDRLPSGQVVRSSAPKRPVIIYPRSGKFESSYNQPYFEMMSRFQAALRLPNTGLLVVGFGYNDSHLVGPLNSALRSNAGLRMATVGPSYESKALPFVESLQRLIEAGDRRLTVVAAGFEELLTVVPDLKAASEEEQHQLRLKKVP